MSTPRERLEAWHLAVSEGRTVPELLFAIAEDACDDLDEAREQARGMLSLLREIEAMNDAQDGTDGQTWHSHWDGLMNRTREALNATETKT